ncbi:hypothetical protein [Actinomadura gamaensis]|uniref:EVE domain-containing protein n=1 Tax=Actinomadura gamaensis TaxID=1763541 RepID=A0ABV9U305_9ACTN
MSASTYLLILGEVRAIAWVLSESRMAFPRTPRSEVNQLAVGDELLIYATRGAFGNPTRDRGRVIGRATVISTVTELDEPVEIARREFPRGCALSIDALAPFRSGVELQPLVEYLDAFPDPKVWSVRLRRPLLRLSERDANLLREALRPMAGSPDEHLGSYLDRAAARPT